jgi:gluconolactonase
MSEAPVRVVAEGLAHPEGPDLLPDGRIVFVETFHGQLSAWDPGGGVARYADVGGGPNACMLGSDGVYVTQNGGTAGPWRSAHPISPSIQKVTWDGRVETVATSADGVPLSAPNDLAFGPDGRLYFTDPGDYDPEHPAEGRICMLHPDGRAEIVEEVGPSYPNGIVAEPDGSIVWDESYTRRVCRRRPDGAVELVTTLPEESIPDGLKAAEDGRMFVTGGPSHGLHVIAPDGEPLGFVETGGEPLNCIFSGQTLYITDFGELAPSSENGFAPAGGRLVRVPVGVVGRPLYRGAIATGAAG